MNSITSVLLITMLGVVYTSAQPHNYQSKILDFFAERPDAIPMFNEFLYNKDIDADFRNAFSDLDPTRDVDDHGFKQAIRDVLSGDDTRTEEEEDDEEKKEEIIVTHCHLHGQHRNAPCTPFEDQIDNHCFGIKCPILLQRTSACTCTGKLTKRQVRAINEFYDSLENPVIIQKLKDIEKARDM
jgi:hypothetical protein